MFYAREMNKANLDSSAIDSYKEKFKYTILSYQNIVIVKGDINNGH